MLRQYVNPVTLGTVQFGRIIEVVGIHKTATANVRQGPNGGQFLFAKTHPNIIFCRIMRIKVEH